MHRYFYEKDRSLEKGKTCRRCDCGGGNGLGYSHGTSRVWSCSWSDGVDCWKCGTWCRWDRWGAQWRWERWDACDRWDRRGDYVGCRCSDGYLLTCLAMAISAANVEIDSCLDDDGVVPCLGSVQGSSWIATVVLCLGSQSYHVMSCCHILENCTQTVNW